MDKLDFEGFLSPAVLEKFAEYMHRNRHMADGTTRSSDNWQKGIPFEAYMKSMFRHFMDVWKTHRGLHTEETQEDALCGLLFNAMGYLHEILMTDEANLFTQVIHGDLSPEEDPCFVGRGVGGDDWTTERMIEANREDDLREKANQMAAEAAAKAVEITARTADEQYRDYIKSNKDRAAHLRIQEIEQELKDRVAKVEQERLQAAEQEKLVAFTDTAIVGPPSFIGEKKLAERMSYPAQPRDGVMDEVCRSIRDNIRYGRPDATEAAQGRVGRPHDNWH